MCAQSCVRWQVQVRGRVNDSAAVPHQNRHLDTGEYQGLCMVSLVTLDFFFFFFLEDLLGSMGVSSSRSASNPSGTTGIASFCSCFYNGNKCLYWGDPRQLLTWPAGVPDQIMC